MNRKLFLFFIFAYIILLPKFIFANTSFFDSKKIVLDSLKPNYTIKKISIIGNNKTKDKIILRELAFTENQLIDSLLLEEKIKASRTNLLKLPLFNYVYISAVKKIDYTVSIYIVVEERWYLWPEIMIINNERNFNIWWQEKNLAKFDYRLALIKYNTLGLNHIFKAGISLGYTEELFLEYKNIFLDKKQKHFIGAKVSYFKQKQVFYQTYENKLQTYTSNSDTAIYGCNARIKYTYRPKFHNKHQITLNYDKINVEDSLISLNNNFLINNSTKINFFSLNYKYIFDKRNDRSYPTEGKWISFMLSKKGLFSNVSDIDIFYLLSSYKIFYKLSNKLFAANSLSIKKSFSKEQPYYFQQGLGYNYYLRGLEYYVIDGQDFYLLKNTLKFQPFPQKISYINFIPHKKFNKIHYTFYFNLFFELGYVADNYININLSNTFANKLLYSGGIGFDVATYYDKVIRLEYSLNQMGERGFFVHFLAPI